jgi:2-polyprenyl-3-methyl-5-hydroxy-6-metoxy-1,4-benzoquinol methylase
MQTQSTPTSYQIKVKGHFDERRMRWFEGLDVTFLPSGETIINGSITDQAALHGVLNRIRDLGMELISVQPKTASTYEPSDTEIRLTLALGLTILSPYYYHFVRGLKLIGNERVLDFGSGSGVCSRHIAACLLKAGGSLDCVDVSHRWIRVARKTLTRYSNTNFHLGHIAEVPVPDGAFDMVVVHFVLHDIPAIQRASVVRALARKLKPEGWLVLREPVAEGFCPDELRQLALNAGLVPHASGTRRILVWQLQDGWFCRE